MDTFANAYDGRRLANLKVKAPRGGRARQVVAYIAYANHGFDETLYQAVLSLENSGKLAFALLCSAPAHGFPTLVYRHYITIQGI
ncbi:MAG TPA: hypothetical protein VMI06_18950 [Terriglobia bacterium]|nr:hypothetical protein [Terriglobia bacterium]